MGETDTISRQAAIEKTEMLYRDAKDDTSYMLIGYNHALSDMRAILKSLPSAQPERKKGRWIDMDDHVMCSCCGAAHYGVDRNYCPNCGGDMRGERG